MSGFKTCCPATPVDDLQFSTRNCSHGALRALHRNTCQSCRDCQLATCCYLSINCKLFPPLKAINPELTIKLLSSLLSAHSFFTGGPTSTWSETEALYPLTVSVAEVTRGPHVRLVWATHAVPLPPKFISNIHRGAQCVELRSHTDCCVCVCVCTCACGCMYTWMRVHMDV